MIVDIEPLVCVIQISPPVYLYLHPVAYDFTVTTAVILAMTQYGPDSRAPAVKVLNYFLLVTSILAVVVRLGTKLLKLRSLFRDDYFIIASLVRITGSLAPNTY